MDQSAHHDMLDLSKSPQQLLKRNAEGMQRSHQIGRPSPYIYTSPLAHVTGHRSLAHVTGTGMGGSLEMGQ